MREEYLFSPARDQVRGEARELRVENWSAAEVNWAVGLRDDNDIAQEKLVVVALLLAWAPQAAAVVLAADRVGNAGNQVGSGAVE